MLFSCSVHAICRTHPHALAHIHTDAHALLLLLHLPVLLLFLGKTHGVRVFWRGWVPLYVKLGPHTLLVFLLTEKFRILMGVESK